MVMAAAAAAASASDEHELLLNRFLPYGSSQLFLEPPGTQSGSGALAPAVNGGGSVGSSGGSSSSSGSSSSLVSSSSLRDATSAHLHPATSRPSADALAAAAALYGSISDVISLD